MDWLDYCLPTPAKLAAGGKLLFAFLAASIATYLLGVPAVPIINAVFASAPVVATALLVLLAVLFSPFLVGGVVLFNASKITLSSTSDVLLLAAIVLVFLWSMYVIGCYAARRSLKAGAKLAYVVFFFEGLLAFMILTGIIGVMNYNALSYSPGLALHDQLGQVYASGYGFSEPMKIIFKHGTSLDSASLLKNDIHVSPEFVRFCPSSQMAKWLPSWPVSACTRACSTGAVRVGPSTQDVSMYAVVCGDATVGSNGLYRVSLGATSKEAAEGCIIPTSCNLTVEEARVAMGEPDPSWRVNSPGSSGTSWYGWDIALPAFLFSLPLVVVAVAEWLDSKRKRSQ